ncbi:MAG TPA: S9 family peptidase [Rubricoccaceae bacterium]|nr:S9 family peptidase [Rubricoccaceae bacterium]
MRRAPVLLLFLLGFLALPAAAQDRSLLTLEKLFASPEFFPRSFQGGRWAEEGPVLLYVEADPETGATSLVEMNLETDARRTLIEGARLTKPDVVEEVGTSDDAGDDASDTDDASGGAMLEIEDYAYSADGSKVLLYTDSEQVWRLNTKGYYYVYDRETGRVTPIAGREAGFQMFAKFDPAAERVAFVRNRDLYVVDLATGRETRLTNTGSEGGVINGTFDWVYEEEFGLRDGFRWSPDGEQIAFFQLDETNTRDFQVTNLRTLYPEYQRFRYPKAGEANSEIRIGVIDVESGQMRFFDTDTWLEGGEETEYIAGMGWTPEVDGRRYVWMIRLNRDQNKMDLLYGDPRTMEVRTILHEENDSYLEVETGFSDVAMGTVTFLRDGEHFILRSDRDGYSHLYLYENDGTLVGQVTQGAWDVTDFHGVDERNGLVYFTATKDDPRERHLYRIGLPGTRARRRMSEPQRITREAGWHGVELSSDFRYVLDTYSTQTTPSVTQLLRSDGTPVTVLEDNAALRAKVEALGLPAPEFMEVPAADGTPLHAYIIKPSDFDPSRAYPLLIHTYGGPGSQEVVNRWGGTERLWHHMLVEEYDILVVGVDNRGTGGRGKAFKTITQRRLGPIEAEDQIAAAQHLGALPYVDEERMGIWGWSYGGYLTLLAMMYGDGPETFKVGAAVAPVSNWRFYDTIYTERYLSTPQHNPEGYDQGSPVTYAANLRDDQRLLMVHGDADDNVHVQNTIVMADALQAAGKQFEMMLYPGRNHGIYGGRTRLHLYTMLTNFFREHLVGETMALAEDEVGSR